MARVEVRATTVRPEADKAETIDPCASNRGRLIRALQFVGQVAPLSSRTWPFDSLTHSNLVTGSA
jgi:hypothetical protein